MQALNNQSIDNSWLFLEKLFIIACFGLIINIAIFTAIVFIYVFPFRNAIGNDFRITEPVVERNFGLIEIDWNTYPVRFVSFFQKWFHVQFSPTID